MPPALGVLLTFIKFTLSWLIGVGQGKEDSTFGISQTEQKLF